MLHINRKGKQRGRENGVKAAISLGITDGVPSIGWQGNVVRRVLPDGKEGKKLHIGLIKWCVIDEGNRRDRSKRRHRPATLFILWLCSLNSVSGRKLLVQFMGNLLSSGNSSLATRGPVTRDQSFWSELETTTMNRFAMTKAKAKKLIRQKLFFFSKEVCTLDRCIIRAQIRRLSCCRFNRTLATLSSVK